MFFCSTLLGTSLPWDTDPRTTDLSAVLRWKSSGLVQLGRDPLWTPNSLEGFHIPSGLLYLGTETSRRGTDCWTRNYYVSFFS